MSSEESRNKRSSEDDMDDGDGDRPTKRQRHDYDSIPAEIRVLMPSRNAGAIIGKGGENVKRLRGDFQASISLPDSQGPERLMTVRGTIGTICGVVTEVVAILEKADRDNDKGDCDIRLLVHQSQAGRIIGKAGTRVKELREETGAAVRVYTECCPQSTDRLTQLTGKTSQVVDCLGRILDLLNGSPTKGISLPYNPNNYEEDFISEYGGFADSRGGMGRGGRGGGGGGRDRDRGGERRSDRMGGRDFGGYRGDFGGRDFGGSGRDFGGSRREDFGGRSGGGFDRGSGGGFGAFGGGLMGALGGRGFMGGARGGESMDKQTSSQVSIPKGLAGAIIGKGGTRIRQVQLESGTVIKMDDASSQSDDRIITINGTQEQIQYAQYLLQMTVKQHANQN